MVDIVDGISSFLVVSRQAHSCAIRMHFSVGRIKVECCSLFGAVAPWVPEEVTM